jgi:polysaccharide biosynthesis transport protein
VNLTLPQNNTGDANTVLDIDGVGTVFERLEPHNDDELCDVAAKEAPEPVHEPFETESVRNSASAEELRLVQHLFFLSGIKGPRLVVFSGVEPDDGAVPVCARVGEVLASLVRQPVCLIDADTSSPSLHWRYNIENVAGFANSRPTLWKDRACHIDGRNLWVLPAGTPLTNRPILFPGNIRDGLKTMREQFGYILIGAPPLSLSAEAVLLGQIADGVVLVVKARSTRRTLALKARKNLDIYDVRVLGAVLNHSTSPVPRILSAKI